ncbi:MAG: carbonic anhydrase family protein [Magnetococcales bacterium]|nr:carbonic anhydrase family protein [Magnetococcales bacterium]
MLWPAGGARAGSGGGGSGAHWSYEGAEGPANWGSLGYPLCASGKNQSPIDIGGNAAATDLDEIQFKYAPAPIQVKNNGHTIQFDYPPGSFITVGAQRFELVQFHFHTPSENTIQGKSYPMEVHLVHKNAEGGLAVVGVMMQTGQVEAAHGGHGAEGGGLETIFGALPAAANLTLTSERAIDAGRLLPHDTGYYHWMGSLTTPPCSEGVRWFLMKEPITIAPAQLTRFQTIFANNARPVQPLNSRNLFIKARSGGGAGAGH